MAFNLRGREDGAQAEIADKASLRAASGGSSRSYVATGQGYWTESDTAATLSTGGRGVYESTAITHALRGEGFDVSEDGTGRGIPLVSMCLNGKAGTRNDAESETLVAQGWRVRRLTPTECERLQGMPDGWTAVQYRGKPAADGPRYRAIGNSWAVPTARWIGDRIRKELGA